MWKRIFIVYWEYSYIRTYVSIKLSINIVTYTLNNRTAHINTYIGIHPAVWCWCNHLLGMFTKAWLDYHYLVLPQNLITIMKPQLFRTEDLRPKYSQPFQISFVRAIKISLRKYVRKLFVFWLIEENPVTGGNQNLDYQQWSVITLYVEWKCLSERDI